MAGGPRRGLMAEILGGLALVMLAAGAVLVCVIGVHHGREQRALLAALLTLEARHDPPTAGRGASSGARAAALPGPTLPDTRWWRVGADGSTRGLPRDREDIDPETAALAAEARRTGLPLLRSGPPWGDVRFALPPDRDGEVAVARLPAASVPGGGLGPGVVTLAILLIDVVIFVAFGATLLRGRLVLPLRRLAAAARELAGGALGVRAPEEGVAETAEVAASFNRMSAALALRTDELEKAVAGLREANETLREAQDGMVRSERLAAVGRLAAGVAHEVGNPMGALLAFLDLVGRDPGLSPAAREHLARASAQGQRVRGILRQMLDFARPARPTKGPVDVRALAEETVALLRAQRRYAGVGIRCVCEEGAPTTVQGDSAAVSQILLNLALNAADAVRGAGGGSVTLRLRPGALRVRAGAPEGAAARRSPDALECRVEDDGPGVPEADRERIFDPFFTTRPPGEGTGLGLANALRLAEGLGGSLELADTDSGACFVLRLPAAGPASGFAPRTEVRGGGAPAGPAPDPEVQA